MAATAAALCVLAGATATGAHVPSGVTAPFAYTPGSHADRRVSISGPQNLRKGAKGKYKLTVKNAGPDDDAKVAVRGHLPKGLKLVDYGLSGAHGFCDAYNLRCTANSLAAGDSMAMKVVVKATKTGKRKLTASVTGKALDPVSKNNSDSFTTKVKPPKRRH